MNMCLAEFVTTYKTTTYVPKSDKPCMPRYKLKISGTEKIIMKRSSKACLRCNIPDILKDEDGYYFSILYLFLPFENEKDIIYPFTSYKEAFSAKHHLMNQPMLQATRMMKQFDLAVKHLMNIQDNIEDVLCTTAPSQSHNNNISAEEGTSSVNNIFNFDILKENVESNETGTSDFNTEMFKKLAKTTMTEDEFNRNKDDLTISQKHVFDYIERNVKDNNSSMHLFITGGAGTGKSFLLRLIKEFLLRQNNNEFPNVLVAAPTGVAAYNINGNTLHTLLQLPTQDKSNAKYRPLSPKSYKFLSETFKYVKYLIIDEISMVSYNTLEHVHLRLNDIKGYHLQPDVYFGNVNIITFGDFYQLPPVFGSTIYADTICNTTLHLWKDFFVCLNYQKINDSPKTHCMPVY